MVSRIPNTHSVCVCVCTHGVHWSLCGYAFQPTSIMFRYPSEHTQMLSEYIRLVRRCVCACVMWCWGNPTPQQSTTLRKSRSEHTVQKFTTTNAIQPLDIVTCIVIRHNHISNIRHSRRMCVCVCVCVFVRVCGCVCVCLFLPVVVPQQAL